MGKNTNQMAEFQALVERFIELANEVKDEGKPIEMINAALMSASCTYATYSAAGNDGYLQESGVSKITTLYRQNLMNLQSAKKKQVNPGKGDSNNSA